MDIQKPHDELFRTAFSHPEQARTLLRSRMLRDPRYRALALRLEWSKLERVDESVADAADLPHASDLLFRVPLGGRSVYLHVVLEHKSSSDPLTAWQMVRYGVRLIDRLHQQLGRPPDLPIVVPVVFFQGPGKWTAARDVRDLFALPEDWTDEERTALRQLLPSWTYLLDELEVDLDERLEIVRHDLLASLVMQALARLRSLDAEALPRELGRIADLLTAVLVAPRGRLLVGMVFSYLAATAKVGPEAVHAAVRATLPKKTAEVMMNPLEKYVHERVEEGIAKGLAKGLAKGEAMGEARGEAKGLTRGRSAGQIDLLRALLEKRFGALPADLAARLANSTSAELESFGLRLLDATTLADVFA